MSVEITQEVQPNIQWLPEYATEAAEHYGPEEETEPEGALVVPPKGNVKPIVLLRELEDIIRQADADAYAAEGTGLRARWECGRILNTFRIPGMRKLKDKTLTRAAADLNVSASQLGFRMQFAKKHPTEESFSHAVREHRSWRAIIKSLPDKPRGSSSKDTLPLKQALDALEKVDADLLHEGKNPELLRHVKGRVDLLMQMAESARKKARA